MTILGISGPINHGKSTVASYLLHQQAMHASIETWEVVAEVAQALNYHFDPEAVRSNDLASINDWLSNLRQIVKDHLNVDLPMEQIEITQEEMSARPELYDKLMIYIDRLFDNPTLAREAIDEDNKEAHRPILQWLGAYMVEKVESVIWYREIMKRARMAIDEGARLYVICGVRYLSDAEQIRFGNGLIIQVIRPHYESQDITDPTESEQSKIMPDITIHNDGSLSALERTCEKVYQDIMSGNFRRTYTTSG